MKFYVYVLYWPGQRECYVGQTYDVKSRMRNHLSLYNRGSQSVYQHWRQHGKPQWAVVAECEGQEQAWKAEKWWIGLLLDAGETLLNDSWGGKGFGEFTDEAAKKNAEATRAAMATLEGKARHQIGQAMKWASPYSSLSPYCYTWLCKFSDGKVRAKRALPDGLVAIPNKASVKLATHIANLNKQFYTSLWPKRW